MRLSRSDPASLPARGAWIEIIREYDGRERLKGRSPHGERGLKYLESLSMLVVPRRSPHGERGLKYLESLSMLVVPRRSPHGERGLKYQFDKRHHE